MPARKCKLCGKTILKTEYDSCVNYKGGYAHENCFNLSLKVLKNTKDEKLQDAANKKKTSRTAKPKSELKDPMSEEDYQKKKAFYEYLRSYCQLEDGTLPAKVYTLVEKYIDQNKKFSYDSMLQTLVYIREILEKEIQGDGIGLIPYYIDEALEYNKNLKQVEENNKELNISEMYQTNVIRIKPSRSRPNKQIDIESI